MKLTLFGATGKTGRCLIDEALSRGAEVTVFARSETPFEEPRARVVRGDLLDRSLLTQAIRGADAVLSALGPTRLGHPATLPITNATRSVVEVMEREGVRRLIATSTGTARPDPGDGFDWKIWLPTQVIRLLMRSAYADMVGLADVIRQSGLDWTLVRLAVLTDGAVAKRLNVGLYGCTKHSFTVSRRSVATFMLDQLVTGAFVGRAPGVSTGRTGSAP